ncbi:MAG: DUF1598 domain-containing protein [Acidobacteriota bacterium]
MKTSSASTLSRRGFLLGLAATPLLVPLSGQTAAGAAEVETRTIRLRPLQKLVRDGLRAGSRLDRSALDLFGMTQIDGFIIDKKNRDVLLFGQVDRRFPGLRLGDLVTAMRNVWPTEEDPACSIDPRKEDLAAAMKVFAEGSAARPGEMKGILERAMAICRRPQPVSVFGVPRASTFAQIMVQADYRMKQVAAGIMPHPAGHRSFKELGFDWMAAEAKRNCGRAVQAPVMARFWFYPAVPSYEQAEGIFAIQDVGVRLLTEEEHLTASGQRVQTGHSHPVAEKFKSDFTGSYREAARKEAIYAELRTLYRLVALAIFLQRKQVLEQTGLDLNLWLHDFPEERAKTPERLDGVAVVQEGQMSCTSPKGTRVGQLWMPMCGGVGVAKAVLGDPSRVTAGGSRLAEMVQRALRAEPKPGQSPFWDVSLPGLRLKEL